MSTTRAIFERPVIRPSLFGMFSYISATRRCVCTTPSRSASSPIPSMMRRTPFSILLSVDAHDQWMLTGLRVLARRETARPAPRTCASRCGRLGTSASIVSTSIVSRSISAVAIWSSFARFSAVTSSASSCASSMIRGPRRRSRTRPGPSSPAAFGVSRGTPHALWPDAKRSERVRHAVLGDHVLPRDLRGALDVVRSTGGDVADDQLLGHAAAEQHRELVGQLLARQELVLLRQRTCTRARAHAGSPGTLWTGSVFEGSGRPARVRLRGRR